MIDFAEEMDISVAAPDCEPREEEVPQPILHEYLPTREEIALACRSIQEGWSDDKRRRRGGFRRGRRLSRVLRVHRMSFTS